MLLLLTGTADLSHPGEVTSPLCDGLMPFVGFFPRSYQNVERLIKSRKENQLLCKSCNTKHLKLFQSSLECSVRAHFSKTVCWFC